jgi:hypothetical protein
LAFRIRIRTFYHQAKKERKTFVYTVWGLLQDFLSLQNDVNVHSKRKKDKKLPSELQAG